MRAEPSEGCAMDYDIFISHASEDKEAVARPLATHLQGLGLRVWLDECELSLGDSLRRKLGDGLVAREDGSEKVVLPIWHQVSASDVLGFSPLLAGKLAVSTLQGLPQVAAAIHAAVRRPSAPAADTAVTLAALESNALGTIRRAMLTADSARDLRRATQAAQSSR
jgi:hypothetical protein